MAGIRTMARLVGALHKAKVRLVLEVKGDSVFGTYEVTPPAALSTLRQPTRRYPCRNAAFPASA